MRRKSIILFICVALSCTPVFLFSRDNPFHLHFAFCDDTIDVAADSTIVVTYTSPLSVESYFNIPLTKETYSLLIPKRKKNNSRLSCTAGVDYLMRFTRCAFMYENDQDNFGKEKRLSPEQILQYQYSDCDDRAALFYYLVKEIYNLPKIALLYPTHITIAVKFDKRVGEPVIYNGDEYSVCDPTAQMKELGIGQIPPKLKNTAYQVVFAYHPENK